MANFLGLSFISDSTFYRMQEFLDKPVIVCGDGQCDSPGHTAKNLCYF